MKTYRINGDSSWLQFIADFAFTGHQYRTSHVLYTKGAVVTASVDDLRLAIKNFEKLTNIYGYKLSPDLVFLWNWVKEVKDKVARLPTFALAVIKDINDREKYYEMRQQDDNIQLALNEVTHCENEIAQITRNEEAGDKLQEIAGLIDELSNQGEKLTLASKRLRFVDKVVDEFVPTLVTQGVEQILQLPLLPPEPENVAQNIIKDIMSQGKESLYLKFSKEFKVPLSVWKEGESESSVLKGIM